MPARPVTCSSRTKLGRRAALAGVAVALSSRAVHATPETARRLLQGFTSTTPREGRVSLRIPEIAEDGTQVPVTIVVESPMNGADHVRALHVVADGNPNPGVVSFAFTPLAGRCEVQFRMRLAQSQRVTALAEMSDGSFWITTRDVTVTVGGCKG